MKSLTRLIVSFLLAFALFACDKAPSDLMDQAILIKSGNGYQSSAELGRFTKIVKSLGADTKWSKEGEVYQLTLSNPQTNNPQANAIWNFKPVEHQGKMHAQLTGMTAGGMTLPANKMSIDIIVMGFCMSPNKTEELCN